jgi:esterase/lipase superfamily enzyme
MTLFLDYRTHDQAGDVTPDPFLYDARRVGGAIQRGPRLTALPSALLSGRHVLFATHGFNVNRKDGIGALERLEAQLALGPGYLFLGVLWPGSWHLPVVNYPAEGKDAQTCGDKLAVFAAANLGSATAVSFLSHSLGGRLVLQAVKKLKNDNRDVRQICLAAPAVDDHCLGPGKAYDAARLKAGRTTVMASESDEALGAIYSAGSFAAKFVGDGHPFGTALGLKGARPEPLARVALCEIPKDQNHRHGDYLPPGDPARTNPRSISSIRVMASAITGGPIAW